MAPSLYHLLITSAIITAITVTTTWRARRTASSEEVKVVWHSNAPFFIYDMTKYTEMGLLLGK